jgi:hypothetical protein
LQGLVLNLKAAESQHFDPLPVHPGVAFGVS